MSLFPRQALDAWIDLYETQHPNVKIHVREQRSSLFVRDGKIDQAALEGIDILIQPIFNSRNLHAMGLVRDLSSLKLPALDPLIAGFADTLARVEGTRVGIPLMFVPETLLLNTQVFTQANLDLPPVDWTLQGFEQTLQRLQWAGFKSHLQVLDVVHPIMAAYGGEATDPETLAAALDQPDSAAALTWLGQAVRDGLLTYSHSGKLPPSIIGGTGGHPITVSQGYSLFLPPEYVTQPMPQGPAGRSTTVDGSFGVVMRSSPNPEVAVDFLREALSNPEAQRALAHSGVRPLIDDDLALTFWREKVGDRHAETVELGLGSATTSGYHWIQLTDGLQAFFEGKATLEQLLPIVKQNLTP